MRPTHLARASALSPYAQALKHVAVRGAAALGPTAREQEMKMYAAGTLPADYKPPVQGQWDDTVERWAYSWQYPSLEEAEETEAYRISKDPQMLEVLKEFAGYLEANPILKQQSQTSQSVPTESEIHTITNSQIVSSTASEVNPITRGANKTSIALQEDSFLAQLDAASRSVGGPGASKNSNYPDSDASLIESAAAMEPIKTTIAEVPAGIPAAYIYDGSIESRLSVRFGQIISDDLGLTYDEEGITTTLQALAYANMTTEARQLFSLASTLGFAINASMFNALLYVDARLGNINPVMKGIEEMKSLGITPTRNTWHLLMVGFTKARDFPAVSQVVDNMKSYANIEPDETTFALQLYALAMDKTKESNVAEAIQLFDQMENVYGYVASRPHYHALMKALASKLQTAPRERLEMLGTKMEMLGIPWNTTTYTIHLRAAQMWGDVDRVKKLFSKLRDDGLPATPPMYAWSIRAHAIAMRNRNYETEFRLKNQSPLPYWIDQLTVCFSIYSLLVKRNEEITDQVLNSLLFSCVSATILAMEHTPDDTDAIMRFEKQAAKIWENEYDAHNITKSVFSFQVYIELLAHQQRIDEAEKLFQDIVLTHNLTPTPRTYEILMFMHLSSGEEGGTARALQYMEAMERSKMPIKTHTLRKFVKVNNEAGYKRDMKRRARRIMQAREEYIARQKEGSPFEASQSQDDGHASTDRHEHGFVAEDSPSARSNAMMDTSPDKSSQNNSVESLTISALAPNPTNDRVAPTFKTEASPSEQAGDAATARSENTLKPLPIDPNSTLAWWHKWRRESISKHELFAVEAADGMPRGESDADRRSALKAMGVEPVDQLPDIKRHALLPKLRKEGEVTGALWAMDGGELSYPKDGQGPQGWGVQLWRERKLMQNELQNALEGREGSTLPEFSDLGVGSRVANDQLAIQEGGLKSPGELADYRQYPNHVYDDGTLKPASEMAHAISPSAELVWKQEANDPLAPFKSQQELSLESENTFFEEIKIGSKGKIQDAIEAIKRKEEAVAEVVGTTLSRRGKHDYLDKWREMYAHGTLEVPDEPITQFGRVPGEGGSLSQSIRSWYKRNRKEPQVAAVRSENEMDARRRVEEKVSRASTQEARDKKRFKSKRK